ncbi:hypothetical protein NQ314_005028 [Rhamnusium bicolor]|uniref:Uncharacterized protein n=1 Tax=Rhamnusium bicolor TaxID=1586634 RepID=A0AAV8ZJV8_9CUCU|nr:hypothetical protein NQ314_005028 [Rhamnusium bicolor]
MSQSPKESLEKNNNDDARLDRKYRHSLQPKPVSVPPPTSVRLTQSQRYDSRGKKKTKRLVTLSQIPSIMEADNSEDEIEKGIEMKKRENKVNKRNKTEITNKATFTFENAAFEGNVATKRNSTATIRTNSSRAPSVQSLEVVREQYCCCAKRTKCERILLITVTVLSIIIIVLVIVIIILAKQDDLPDIRSHFKL